jgi:hypothetical protein
MRKAMLAAVVGALAAGGATGCGGQCTTHYTMVGATFQNEGSTAPGTWRAGPYQLLGDAIDQWRAAVADSDTAPAGSGILLFSGPVGPSLWLQLPFPLKAGASLAFSPTPASRPVSSLYTAGPAGQSPGALLESCNGSGNASCPVEGGEVVNGRVQVLSQSPLSVHIDLAFSYGPSAPGVSDGLTGDVTFSITDEDVAISCWPEYN